MRGSLYWLSCLIILSRDIVVSKVQKVVGTQMLDDGWWSLSVLKSENFDHVICNYITKVNVGFQV